MPESYYEAEIEAMRANESSTMFIDFSHAMLFNDILQKAIADEYLRFLFLIFNFHFSKTLNLCFFFLTSIVRGFGWFRFF